MLLGVIEIELADATRVRITGAVDAAVSAADRLLFGGRGVERKLFNDAAFATLCYQCCDRSKR